MAKQDMRMMSLPLKPSGDTTITEFFKDRGVFVTGGSGFIGKVLIEKLLRSSPGIGNVYVLIRNKKGKTPAERVRTITDQPLFNLLKKQNPSALKKIVPVNGDITEIGLECSPLTENEFINAVTLCLKSTYFTYNKFYSQIFGTAMGSPISATIANLVMEELENTIIQALDYKPIFYKRYVDDCLICLPKDKIDYCLSEEDRNIIIKNVTVIFNLAASVRFDNPLKDAILQNVRSAREIISLVEMIGNVDVLVHVSTAYTNCDKGVIEERLYTPHVDWRDAIEIAEQGDDFILQVLTEKYTSPLPNTYTFTKSLAEHLVKDLCTGRFPTVIMRPSIVISAVGDPLPGWTDNLNGPFAMMVSTAVGLSRVFYARRDQPLDHVSVDNFAKSVIIAAWEKAVISKEIADISIYNSCSEMKMSMDLYMELGYRSTKKNPLEQKLWTTTRHVFVTQDANLYLLLMILLQVLPAILLDGLIRLFDRKPILLKIQRKIYIGNVAVNYFMARSVIFRTRNYNDLLNKLPEEDKQQYKLLSVDLEEYSDIALRGIKEFLLKKNPDVSSRTIFIDKCWTLLDSGIWYTGYAMVLYFVFCNRHYAFDFLEGFYIYWDKL